MPWNVSWSAYNSSWNLNSADWLKDSTEQSIKISFNKALIIFLSILLYYVMRVYIQRPLTTKPNLYEPDMWIEVCVNSQNIWWKNSMISSENSLPCPKRDTVWLISYMRRWMLVRSGAFRSRLYALMYLISALEYSIDKLVKVVKKLVKLSTRTSGNFFFTFQKFMWCLEQSWDKPFE